MSTEPQRFASNGRWRFAIGPEFEVSSRDDSVQATDGRRVVYVSSLTVGAPGAVPDAAKLRALLAKRLGAGERLSHAGAGVEGDAEIARVGDQWRLSGTMCSTGAVATCVIDYATADDRAWAESVWKSLSCEAKVE
jgi:hypothetical protein